MRFASPLVLMISLWVHLGSSQHTVFGVVSDAISQEPLVGVSVFYDGMTISTITDDQGAFELTTKSLMTANLVISYIGYDTRIFDGDTIGDLGNIPLAERAIRLNEVVLKPDTWSREKN